MFVDMVFFGFNRLWPFLFPNKRASESKRGFLRFHRIIIFSTHKRCLHEPHYAFRPEILTYFLSFYYQNNIATSG